MSKWAALDIALTRAVAAHHDCPLQRLEAIREARRTLRHLERENARHAQRLGYGGELIARALGVSRTTAHRRHGATTPRPRPSDAP